MGTTAINFDANGVKPETGPEPVPNGEYRAMITASEIKATKDSTPDRPASYLQLSWTILDGQYKGRVIWDRLNVQNPSAEAQRIGQGQLSAVCHATGVMKLTDSKQLHNIPVLLKVVVKESKGYDPKNEIKKYTAIAGSSPVAAAAVPTSNATPAAAAPAWATKK